MKKNVAVVALIVLAFGAHAQVQPGSKPPAGTGEAAKPVAKPVAKSAAKKDPARPVVSVVAGEVRIDQEVIWFKGKKKVDIVWRVDTPNFRFTEDGITFSHPEWPQVFKKCMRSKTDPREFSCENLNAKRDFYKYVVRVEDQNGNRLPDLDPFVLND
jgi:hypothetical protein